MAKPKPYYIDTPNYLYKYDTLDKSMFAFVLGVQFVIPSIRIKEAVEGFIELYNLNEDNYRWGSFLPSIYDGRQVFGVINRRWSQSPQWRRLHTRDRWYQW